MDETFVKHLEYERANVAGRDEVEATVLGKYTRSFGVSLAITSVLSCLLVVVKELDEGVLNWMKGATPHHWITHGVFAILAFAIIGFGLAQLHGGTGVRISAKHLTATMVGAVAISGLVIAAFYLIHG
jgi:hypothetical protein